jgi:outer membrane scaffolding protein for murein synthesis (MipA/OmpV family)
MKEFRMQRVTGAQPRRLGPTLLQQAQRGLRPVVMAVAVYLGLSPRPCGAWGNLLLMDAPPALASWAAGGSVWSLPRYPGAASNQATLLPALEWRDARGLFASTDSGLGWNLSPSPQTPYGVRLWPQLGRRAADVPAGIGAVGPRLQAELYANHQPLEALLLQGGVLVGAGQEHDGVQVELGATSGLPLGADLLGVGMSATWANSAYRRSYFGISAAQSARSGLPGYDPGGGWTDCSLTVSLEHRFSAHWRLDVQAYRVLYSPGIGQSPLVASRRPQAVTASVWHDF